MAADYNIDYLCACVGIPYHQLKMRSRKQVVVFARYIVMDYLMKSGLTQAKTGEVFNVGHTTARRSTYLLQDAIKFNQPRFVLKMYQSFYDELAEEPFCPFIETKHLESCFT
ncbi:MAG: hypothetical protein RBT74_17805 [Tenuifilaceae bacterium]|nr:hypothetical protein [Tenuifilaceae bacterium]